MYLFWLNIDHHHKSLYKFKECDKKDRIMINVFTGQWYQGMAGSALLGLTQLQSSRERSGSVLDSRPRGRGFEPHRRHCVVSLSKNINPSLVLVQPRKTRPFLTERLLMGRKELNQTKATGNNKKICCK